jgi:hypothetical protein
MFYSQRKRMRLLGNLKKDLDIFATSWKNTENPARQE